jgi:hypothetical protein
VSFSTRTDTLAGVASTTFTVSLATVTRTGASCGSPRVAARTEMSIVARSDSREIVASAAGVPRSFTATSPSEPRST